MNTDISNVVLILKLAKIWLSATSDFFTKAKFNEGKLQLILNNLELKPDAAEHRFD